MADRENSFHQNVPGKFFVDSQCIDCDMCSETAPENFARSEKGHAYVCKQPENEEEERLCENAQSSCPVEAIGSDE
ncbi:MAG: ferredoxin [Verrucomicrobia bacterium]|jgi:ferredoxin|nr:ferredoxin [Verrucomicrobiota bacterium]NCC60696.1 ferredoxin [Verrucomicrobiae bacterium]